MTNLRNHSELEETLHFQIEALGLPAPRRQFKAIPGRGFVFDFAWPAQMLLVEVQGGGWVQGAHTRGWGLERDAIKACLAIVEGWNLLPVTGKMIENGEALQFIEKALFRENPSRDLDVSRLVSWSWNDGEDLPLTKCVCGKEWEPWSGPVVGFERDDPRFCDTCGRAFYWRGTTTRVFEITKMRKEPVR